MKVTILLLLLMTIFNIVSGQKVKVDEPLLLVVGTYTSDVKNDGIYVYDFNSITGGFELKSKKAGEENPSFLAFNKTGSNLYAANEVKSGNVSSFSVNRLTGELSFLNRVSSGGNGPCFVEVDPRGKFVYAGNYGSGTLSAIPINTDGTLSTEIQTIRHQGSGADKARQQGPHVHATVVSPDNRFLFVPDLGTDKVNIYAIDINKNSSPLTESEQPFISVKPGSGPRHIAFHPGGKTVYVILEMAASVTVFDYSGGKLSEKQNITMLAEGFSGKVGAADIHISPDGKFLYASNRGDANDIAIYSVKKDGTLSHLANQSVLGKNPRNFAIDPTGNFLLAANQGSNEIVIFRRDRKSGLLTPLAKRIEVPKPVCLKFAPVN